MNRDDLADLKSFQMIVEEGGFRRAAVKLGVSPSALSHAMRRLETKLDTALLLRTTRSVTPTEAGTMLMGRLRTAFQEIDRGLVELAGRSGQIAGTVRINVHRTAADLILLPRMRLLQNDYPRLKIELVIDDGITDIVAAGCDAGIRTGERLASDMIAVRLSPDYHTAIVCDPAYLEGRSTPSVPDDLQKHRCIAYRFVTSRALHRWHFRKGERDLKTDFDPALIVDDVQVAIRAARHGLGFAYVLKEAVVEYLDDGSLVEVLQDWSVTVAGDFLYYPGRNTVSPELRVLIDSLRF